MVELTLVRHGQAQTGARDEASYDQLSDLGHQQARWLGEVLRQDHPYDRIISGAMTRQVETAQSLGLPELPHKIDPRLNELDYFGLAESLRQNEGIDIPYDMQSFALHVPQVLDAWRNRRVHDHLESYDDFRNRIRAAVADAAGLGGRSLLVTSTGVIATLTAMALDLDIAMKTRIFLRIRNTSVHRFVWQGGELHLSQYGATPHLDHAARNHALTYG